MIKRYRLIFKGRVQGVGFRAFVRNICRRYSITGYVRNLVNGDVEAEFEGQKDVIERALLEIKDANTFIRVDSIQKQELSELKNYKDFIITY